MMRATTLLALSIFAAATCAQLRADDHPIDGVLPADASIDRVLDALNERGKPPTEFIAKVSDATIDTSVGTDQKHTGMIWFSRQSPTRLRLHVLFDKVIVGHVIQNQKREYLLDGEWLTARSYDAIKTETKYQVMKPGEKKDLMKLGAGTFPLPIGQDKDDVKKAFDVTKVAPAKDDPPQAIHLTLTPRPGTDLAKKFTSIDIWVDRGSHMPVVIDTLSDSEEHRVEMKEIQVNPNPPLSDKDFTLPDVDSSWNLKTEAYGS